jgi:cyclase
VSLNSAAIRQPDLIDRMALNFGSQFVVVAIDALEEGGKWTAYINGGRIATDKELFSWAREAEDRGAGEILFTSMNHDGTKNGFACEALAGLSELLTIPVIASGGAGNMEHFAEVFTKGRADAGLAASIFHFNEITVPQLKAYLDERNIAVRI